MKGKILIQKKIYFTPLAEWVECEDGELLQQSVEGTGTGGGSSDTGTGDSEEAAKHGSIFFPDDNTVYSDDDTSW